jgi:S1-C subfamily serine protease
VPASVPDGKKLLCPKCKQQIVLGPELDAGIDEADQLEVSGSETAEPAQSTPPLQALPDDGPPPQAEPLASPAAAEMATANDKSCPYCGELIKASAIKCRHCGEFLETRPGRAAAGQAANRASSKSNEADLTPAEYITATLLAPAGLLIGLVWAIKRSPKARNMLVVSTAMSGLIAASSFLAYWYWPRQPDTHVDAGQPPGGFYPPDMYNPDDYLPPDPGDSDELVSRPDTIVDSDIDLEGQPPEIRQALQANVRVELPGISSGSGVVLKRQDDWAWIISNRHVVDMRFARAHGQATTPPEKIVARVTYVNNQSTRATVAWEHPDYDLVILKARCPDEIQPATWKPFPKLSIGEDCFAVGNPVNLGWTYTRGVVSALRTESQEVNRFQSGPVIQTDVAIASGSSGGGLYNKEGVLIGINTAIVHPQIAKGIGFAIQTTVLDQLKPEPLGYAPAPEEPDPKNKKKKTQPKEQPDQAKPQRKEQPEHDDRPPKRLTQVEPEATKETAAY